MANMDVHLLFFGMSNGLESVAKLGSVARLVLGFAKRKFGPEPASSCDAATVASFFDTHLLLFVIGKKALRSGVAELVLRVAHGESVGFPS